MSSSNARLARRSEVILRVNRIISAQQQAVHGPEAKAAVPDLIEAGSRAHQACWRDVYVALPLAHRAARADQVASISSGMQRNGVASLATQFR